MFSSASSLAKIAISPTTARGGPSPVVGTNARQQKRAGEVRSFAQRRRDFPDDHGVQTARLVFLLNVLAGGTARALLATWLLHDKTPQPFAN